MIVVGPDLKVHDIEKAALAGDPLALMVVREAAEHLGTAIAGLLNLMNPAVVVLGVGAYAVTRRKDDPAKTALESTAVPPAPMGFGDAAAEAGGTAQSELPPELPPQ